ncbi:MAG: TonB family protein [Deltaproteobacteria bacterium]|nr:TonB family protein [Deltaproteobacteria bacterium]
MSASSASSTSSASPLMLLASVLLHGIALSALVLFSATVLAPSRPVEVEPTQVKLVEAPGGTPIMEKITPDPDSVVETPLPHEAALVDTPAQPEPQARHKVERKLSSAVAPTAIPLKQRRTKPKTVEAPPKDKPNPDKDVKKEDPQAFLDKRLAAIQSSVDKKRAADSKTNPNKRGLTRLGVQDQHSGLLDPEIARWFGTVRRNVNSRWSVFEDSRNLDRATVIGVKLGDNGELVHATVDETSGDKTFDSSAMSAVFQAAPFPPLPEQLREKIRQAGGLALRFTRGGMQ